MQDGACAGGSPASQSIRGIQTLGAQVVITAEVAGGALSAYRVVAGKIEAKPPMLAGIGRQRLDTQVATGS